MEREKGLCQVLTLAEDGLTYKMQNNKVHQELRQQNSANINRKIPDSAKNVDSHISPNTVQILHCTLDQQKSNASDDGAVVKGINHLRCLGIHFDGYADLLTCENNRTSVQKKLVSPRSGFGCKEY